MNTFFRIFSVLCLLMFQHESHAEYILVKKESEKFVPLDPKNEEDSTAYSTFFKEILMKYQWPMLTIHFDDLTDEEKDALLVHQIPSWEKELLQHKVDNEIGDEKYKVIFVPTILWEIYALDESTINKAIHKEHTPPVLSETIPATRKEAILKKFEGKKPLLLIKKIRDDFSEVLESYYETSLQNNIEDLNQHIQTLLNLKKEPSPNYKNLSKIIDFYNTDKKNELLYIQLNSEIGKDIINITDNIGKLAEITFQKLQSLEGKTIGIDAKLLTNIKEFLSLDLLKRIIKDEFQAEKNNQALLFRSTDTYNNKIDSSNYYLDTQLHELKEKIKQNSSHQKFIEHYIGDKFDTLINEKLISKDHPKHQSLSFGNSLFAGILFDKTASTICYAPKSKVLYALPLSKAIYFGKFKKILSAPRRLFWISPLSTGAGLMSAGEVFHSRTRLGFAGVQLSDYKIDLSQSQVTSEFEAAPEAQPPIYNLINKSGFSGKHLESLLRDDILSNSQLFFDLQMDRTLMASFVDSYIADNIIVLSSSLNSSDIKNLILNQRKLALQQLSLEDLIKQKEKANITKETLTKAQKALQQAKKEHL